MNVSITRFPSGAAALVAIGLGLAGATRPAAAEDFVPTAGTHVWNDDNNWGPGPPLPFPNGTGAIANFPAPTGALVIDLGQPITLGSLTINKSTTSAFSTTVTATAPNGLTFDGGGAIATTASFANGGGTSIVAAPVSFNGPLVITQGDDQILRFTGSLSGSGSVEVKRDNNGEEFVAFNADNSYAGSTSIFGNAGTLFTVLRLNSANSIPGGIGTTGGTSNITLTNSGILGLGSTDFTRSIGTLPDQIQFVTPLNSGFAAFDATRVVNLGGAAAQVSWATAGFGTLTFGSPTSNATVDFQNPISLGNANRTIRAVDGTAPIDGRISASITSTGAANNVTKTGGGTLSLAAANSYTGNTIINGGALRLDHPQALPANTNVALSGGGVLGLGAGDLIVTLGTGPGQLQFGTGNAGFAAYGADRKVTLNGGAPLVWGAGGFTVAGNFILSDDGADALVEVTNAIDISGAARTFAGRNGTATIDSKISGVISGAAGIIKTQGGTLELSAANTFTGTTSFNAGTLLLTNENSVPGGIQGGSVANISIGGGVVGLGHGNFTAPLGTGPGQVQFVAGTAGGFGAFGADRIVNIGGASAPLTWDVGEFAPSTLILGAGSSDRTVDFQNPIDLNGALRIFTARDGTAAIDAIVSSVISGAGGILQKDAAGTLAFTAANTYNGGTVIEAGRLLANNTTGSAVGSGDVTVTADGILGGTGFVGTSADKANVTVSASGRIAPGASAGKLSVAGDVTWEAGAHFDVEIGGASPGQFDVLAINGAATLAGTLHVDVLDGFLPAAGASFEVLTATDGLTGTFDAITSVSGIVWHASYAANSLSLIPSLAADFDGDGSVDGDDLDVWSGKFGLAEGATSSQGDSDRDGDVDGADFLVWQRQVGSSLGGSATTTTAAVPEPSALAMVCLALHNGFLRVRRKVRRRKYAHGSPLAAALVCPTARS